MVSRVAATVALGLLAGCSGGAKDAALPASPAPSVAAPAGGANAARTSPTACSGGKGSLVWPGSVPADLPTPPGGRLTDVEERTDGLTVVKFSTDRSLREGIVFLVEALPRAGFTVGRGDAELTEADAPFTKGALRGVLRMIAVEQCRTDWLLAVTKGGATGGSPLLPARPSASPLPFG